MTIFEQQTRLYNDEKNSHNLRIGVKNNKRVNLSINLFKNNQISHTVIQKFLIEYHFRTSY